MLKNQKWAYFQNFEFFGKISKGGTLGKKIFSFLFDIIFYYGISKETIRMPFRGLTMLKSPKLTIKGGLCYVFAMVWYQSNNCLRKVLFGGAKIIPLRIKSLNVLCAHCSDFGYAILPCRVTNFILIVISNLQCSGELGLRPVRRRRVGSSAWHSIVTTTTSTNQPGRTLSQSKSDKITTAYNEDDDVN